MNRTRKTRKRITPNKEGVKVVSKVVKPKAEKGIPSFSVTYQDADNSVKTTVIEMANYQSSLSYKENFEDKVASVLADGGIWIEDKYVIPNHRILRFKINKYEDPKGAKKTDANNVTFQTKKANGKSKEVKGKVSNDRVNACPAASLYVGQGGAMPYTSVPLLKPQYLTEGYDPRLASTN